MKKLLLFAVGLSACGEELCTSQYEYPVSVRADRGCPAPNVVVTEVYENTELHSLLRSEAQVDARSVCWYRVERSEEVERACTKVDRSRLLELATLVQVNDWTLNQTTFLSCDGPLYGVAIPSDAECSSTFDSDFPVRELVGRDEYPAVLTCTYDATTTNPCGGGGHLLGLM